MSCSSCMGAAAERQFSEKRATEDLAQYRAKGPGSTALLLLEGIAKAGQSYERLLDIGAGVGVLTFELLQRGVAEAVGVDLSAACIASASDEAARRGLTDVARFVRGDFVDMATQLPTADIVTLDRVICCYPDYEQLLDASVRHADHCLALSYPKDVWYVRAWVRLQNLTRYLRGNAFRTFVHSATGMERAIRQADFGLVSRRSTWTWCADVYRLG